jgi:riboflavin kinase/FMN adenylyltransferase
LEGDIPAAAALLGRAPFLTGAVVPGDQRGRTIGFPTANVDPEPELLPAAGVYATWVTWPGHSKPRPSVTNIGRRPTFGGGHVTVEVHLLDFAGDLYGQRLRVELAGRLRDERRFEGLDALVAQLHRDVAAARAVLGGA